MAKKKAAVIIPFYNYARFIDELLEGILCHSDLVDVIIIDDKSNDEDYKYIVDKYSSNKDVIINRNDENMGINKTYWKGMELAKDKYDVVFLCDADDIWSKDKISKVLKEFDKGFNFVSHRFKKFNHPDPESRIDFTEENNWNEHSLAGSYSGATYSFTNEISKYLLTKNIERETRGLNDYFDLFIMTCLHNHKGLKHSKIQEELINVRIHNSNNSGAVAKREFMLDKFLKIRKKYKNFKRWGSNVSYYTYLNYLFLSGPKSLFVWFITLTYIMYIPLFFLKTLRLK